MAHTLRELVPPNPKMGENPIVAGSGVRVARALRDRNCATACASKMMQVAAERMDRASMRRVYITREVGRCVEAGRRAVSVASVKKMIYEASSEELNAEAVRRHTMRNNIAAHRVASLRITGTII